VVVTRCNTMTLCRAQGVVLRHMQAWQVNTVLPRVWSSLRAARAREP
jgi:hypothetical protein